MFAYWGSRLLPLLEPHADERFSRKGDSSSWTQGTGRR